MKITSIERNKKCREKLSVYVDDKYSFSISEEDFIILNLYEKKAINQEEISYIKETVNFNAARARAIKYLALKLHSGKEVRSKLKSEGFENDIIQRTVEELTSMGYINDKIFARKYIYDRSKLKPMSKKLLGCELQSRGINREISDEVLADWEADDAAVAESLVKRRFGKYDLSDDKIIRRVFAFLNYRGFSHEIIEAVINKCKRED